MSSVNGIRGTSIRQVTTSSVETVTLTPQQYADAVSDHARQDARTSPFPGPNFENLANYLQQGLDDRPKASRSFSQSSSLENTFPFLTVYSFHGAQNEITRCEIADPTLCPALTEGKPMVFFLRGKPSSKWLSSLGAMYRVDPEFFNRHLDFRSTRGRIDYFSLPSLSSAQPMLFQLPYMILGQIQSRTRQAQATIEALRSDSVKRMDKYWEDIHKMFEQDSGVGESLVRKFYLHDQTHFALQQRISIALNKAASSWQLFIWLDTGLPLSQSSEITPWRGLTDGHKPDTHHSARIYPTIRSQPSVALKSHLHKIQADHGRYDDHSHNISFLHCKYAKQLSFAMAAADPFFVLYDIFHFVADSYKQYLNMLEQKDVQRTLLNLNGGDNPLDPREQNQQLLISTNLRYDQATLESHIPQLRSILDVIRYRGNSGPPSFSKYAWPRSTDEKQDELAFESSQALLHDFELLLSQAERLLERYRDGMSLLINHAVIAEAARSFAQAKEVTKLTRLAFVYVPLSFTAAFFGMNVHELSNWGGSQGEYVPLWLWVIVSVPVLLISYGLMIWDLKDIRRSLARWAWKSYKRFMGASDTGKESSVLWGREFDC